MATRLLKIRSGKLAVFELGKEQSGNPIIFIHGGPGDTHHYMKRMAEPIAEKQHCVFYDQRGSGESRLDAENAETLALANFFEDLITIKTSFGLERLTLAGHSWGAILALYFAAEFPQFVERLALISMGPLDPDHETICNQRLLSAMSSEEQKNWQHYRNARAAALASGDTAGILACDRELMGLRVKSWVFKPELREAFLEEYFRDPPPNRAVNKLVWEGSRSFFSWEKLARVQSPLWICYGENDFAPVVQAKKIAEKIPDARISLLKECGHIPWLDQPTQFYPELSGFLGSAGT